MRSDIIKRGSARAPARAMLKGAGFTDADLEKPLVGIANTWTEVTPCNVHLRTLAESVKEGIREAGGTPIEFNTIAVSDGITMGTEGCAASLVSREVIADSIELFVMAHLLDGVVALSGCDKTMPGTVMALARLDVPSLMLYGGPIAPGPFDGRDVTIQDVFEAVGAHAAGKMSGRGAEAPRGQRVSRRRRVRRAVHRQHHGHRASPLLGISPMGANEVPATDAEKATWRAPCGAAVMRMIGDDLRSARSSSRARRFENAIASAAATAGSTNAVLHLLAIAHEAGVPLSIDDFDPISARTPVLADLKPGGRFTAVDMHRAGGERLLGQRAARRRSPATTRPTCTGRTLFEEIAESRARRRGQQVVRPDRLAASSRAGASPSCAGRSRRRGACSSWRATTARPTWARRASSTAKRRRSRRCRPGSIQAGDVVVIRYEGPTRRARHARDARRDGGARRPRPRRLGGARHRRALQRRDVRNDGGARRRPRRPQAAPSRWSGTATASSSTCAARRLDVRADLASRRPSAPPRGAPELRGVMGKYADQVSSASLGAVTSKRR